MSPFTNALTSQIAAFLEEIGLPVERRSLPQPTFLPGIRLEYGRLVVDEERLLYPGDLLHEAGHLAVLEPAQRAAAVDSPGDGAGEEIAAIAWSWAALTQLNLPPEVVFHPHGYKGSSDAFISNFQEGRYIGVPLLQWYGMTLDERNAQAQGKAAFPQMQRWLRE